MKASEVCLYLGPRGTFCHQAAEAYFQGSADTTFLEENTIQKVVHVVANGKAQYGIIPIENSAEGAVETSIDSLYLELSRGNQINAIGEIVLPVAHCLIGLENTDLEKVKTIYSHPKALGQCRENIAKLWPQREPLFIATSSTAEAVSQICSGKDPTAVAIGSLMAAKSHKGFVLAENFQDKENNRTRFLILSKDKSPKPTGSDRTFIMFSCAQKVPGSLRSALKPLEKNNFNLNFIYSREVDLGQYYFCLEFNGHAKSIAGKKAIEGIGEVTEWLYEVGSYPTKA